MRWVFLVNLGRLVLKARELGIQLLVFTFWRSVEDQLKEFAAGRSQVKYGQHQVWLAVDLAVWEDSDADGVVDRDEIRWKNDPKYEVLGVYWESLGGVWGGRWVDPHDIYHFEYGPGLIL